MRHPSRIVNASCPIQLNIKPCHAIVMRNSSVLTRSSSTVHFRHDISTSVISRFTIEISSNPRRKTKVSVQRSSHVTGIPSESDNWLSRS